MSIGVCVLLTLLGILSVQAQSSSLADRSATLSGSAVVPPVVTTRTGTAGVSLVAKQVIDYGYYLSWTITHDIPDLTTATLHRGSRGENVAVYLDITPINKAPGTFSGEVLLASNSAQSNFQLFYDVYEDLRNDRFYVLLSSQTFPQGELRANLQTSRIIRASTSLRPPTIISCGQPAFPCSLVIQYPSSIPPTARVELVGPGVNITVNTTGIELAGQPQYPFGGSIPFETVISTYGGVTSELFRELLQAGQIDLIVRVAEGILYGPHAYFPYTKPTSYRANLSGSNGATGVFDLVVYSESAAAEYQVSHSLPNPISLVLQTSFATPVTIPLTTSFEDGWISSVYIYAYGIAPGGALPDSSVQISNTLSQSISGPLFAVNRETFCGNLSGSAQLPPVTTLETGTVLLELIPLNSELFFTIQTSDLSNKIGVQLRGPATASQTAPVLATLCSQFCNQFTYYGSFTPNSPLFAPGVTMEMLLGYLREGLVYVDIQSEAFPAGYLRANLAAKNLTESDYYYQLPPRDSPPSASIGFPSPLFSPSFPAAPSNSFEPSGPINPSVPISGSVAPSVAISGSIAPPISAGPSQPIFFRRRKANK